MAMQTESKKTVFHFVTLFPELVQSWMATSILGRAEERGLFETRCYRLRDFSTDSYRTVDDQAYGGGGGMVLKIEPLVAAVEHIRTASANPLLPVFYFSPKGKKMSQSWITEMAHTGPRELILICGRYEGVDQRFIDDWVDLEISLGDFVLTGGELPALAFAECFARQLEGVIHHDQGALQESFALNHEGHPVLEHPHYTRPAEFRGRKVPPVLLSGDHGAIEAWRKAKSVEMTRSVRPDLLSNLPV